jgi:hypothetical protein
MAQAMLIRILYVTCCDLVMRGYLHSQPSFIHLWQISLSSITAVQNNKPLEDVSSPGEVGDSLFY